jgi:hypothetical protein
MTANIDAMLRAGVEAYRAGNKLEARTMLEKVLELDEYNEMAWLWLSAVVETPEEKRTCFENVLVINPNNENAKKGLNSLGMAATPPPTPPMAKTGTGPFTAAPIEDDLDDDPPTASSSASAVPKGKQRGGSDYDQWISGLGIGGSDTKSPTADDDIDDVEMFDDGLDNLFDDDEDSALVPAAPPPVARKSTAAPARPAPAPVPDEDFDYGDPFADDEEVDFDTAVNQDINKVDSSLFETNMFDEDYQDEEQPPDPTEFFKLIPKEIQATRLPGERETYPKPLIAALVVLVILNLGALGFLVTQLG